MNKQAKKKSIYKGTLYLLCSLFFIIISIYNYHELSINKRSYNLAVKEKEQSNQELSKIQTAFNELDSEEALLNYARSHYIFTKDNEKVVNLPLDD